MFETHNFARAVYLFKFAKIEIKFCYTRRIAFQKKKICTFVFCFCTCAKLIYILYLFGNTEFACTMNFAMDEKTQTTR